MTTDSASALTLPPEVWSHVLRNVPAVNLPQMLAVSSLFHDVTIRYLFASVKLYFIGTHRGQAMLNTTSRVWVEETARKLMCKSWELLNYICEEPRFARVVKTVTVLAFGDGQSLFEKLTVANALSHIPNLKTFRWIGTGPDFGGSVAECLPSSLRRLDIQSALPLESLRHLNGLDNLQLSIPFYFPDDEEAHDDLAVDESVLYLIQPPITSIFEQLQIRPRILRLESHEMSALPIRILNDLNEIDIVASDETEECLIGLDLVFRHANSLVSLTLAGRFPPTVLDLLPRYADGALPSLTSIYIGIQNDDPFRGDCIARLIHFLRGRGNLRRLHLRLPGLDKPDLHALMELIGNLPALETLGLHTGWHSFYRNDLDILKVHLSPKLRALHLALDMTENEPVGPLLDVIGKLPRLTFLHLYGILRRVPILLEDLANENVGLQMIGLNRALWDIERSGPDIITHKWPRWKIKFCIEEDFLCEDDYWLFKYN